MNAYLSSTGDTSVGIWGFNHIIELGPETLTDYDEQREDFRAKLATAFECLAGETVRVIFSDEIDEEITL